MLLHKVKCKLIVIKAVSQLFDRPYNLRSDRCFLMQCNECDVILVSNNHGLTLCLGLPP